MAITNASTLAEYASGIGTQNATLTVDANNKRVGVGTTNPLGTFQVGTGVTFWGDAGIGSFTSLKLSGTTDSTSTSTGALVVTGGVGIGLSLTVGGDVSIGGTLTYEDVTNIDSIGILTARSGLRVVGGGITCVGVATFFSALDVNSTTNFADDVVFTGAAANVTWDKSTDDLIFNDNAQAKFGTDGDLSIYHTGSEAIIKNDTGITYLRGDVIRLRDQGGSYTLLNAGTAGVDLYGGSSLILGTGAGGVSITGITTINGQNFGFPSDSAQPEATLLVKCSGLGGNNRFIGIGASGTGAWIQASSPGYSGLAAPLWINKGGGDVRIGIYGTRIYAKHSSATNVGIGTDMLGYPSYADNLTVANHGLHCGLTIRSGIASQSAIYFSNTTGSAAGTYGGSIYYDHGTKLMSVNTDGTNSLLINEDHGLKVIGIATASSMYEGSQRVSTVGKAIAMAMIFG